MPAGAVMLSLLWWKDGTMIERFVHLSVPAVRWMIEAGIMARSPTVGCAFFSINH